jgi:hypothetical protein
MLGLVLFCAGIPRRKPRSYVTSKNSDRRQAGNRARRRKLTAPLI